MRIEPKIHEMLPDEWECSTCGSLNFHPDIECQWCRESAEDCEAIIADHIIDRRKHER